MISDPLHEPRYLASCFWWVLLQLKLRELGPNALYNDCIGDLATYFPLE